MANFYADYWKRGGNPDMQNRLWRAACYVLIEAERFVEHALMQRARKDREWAKISEYAAADIADASLACIQKSRS